VKVLIVDDHPIVIAGCRALLAETDDMIMVEAHDAASGREAYEAHKPDLAIVGTSLPDISGYELARRILCDDSQARIIMFSMSNDTVFAAQAIEVGARGFISKSDDPHAFLATIRTVYAGGESLPRDMARKDASDQAKLNGREREILRLLAKGQSMSEIAALINVSYKTVATTCSALRQKFNARTPMHLIRIAVEQKIVTAPFTCFLFGQNLSAAFMI
jgi:DNA-binding NarL/FixJ family response regulator